MNFSDLPDVIELRQPLWLLLSLIPFVFLFLHYLQAQSQLPGSHFDNNMRYWYIHQQPSLLFQQRQSFIIEILFWLALSLSLAGPEYAESQNHSVNKHGDIFLVVLDASASMNSRDEQPSRLLRAKSEILLLSDKLKPADRLGVLLFSGSSHLLFPPTADRQAIDFFVQQIRGNLLPVAGTNIISALAETRSQLALFDDTMAKYVILISDGDIDNEEIVLEKISGLKLNLAVNTIAVGKYQNSPVPAYNEDELWQRHADGRIVVSNRNDRFLQQLAEITRGRHRVISPSAPELDFINSNKNTNNTHSDSDRSNNNWIQLYHGFLLLAIMLFFYKRLLKGAAI